MIKFAVLAILLRFSLFWGQNEAATFDPILPPSFPLAVRNPYVSAWLPGNETNDISKASPEFWFGNKLTWSVIANVDKETYNLFGVPSPASGTKSGTLQKGSYTSTHTVFEIAAGNALFTLDFFSPVSGDDYVRQSLPFSYLTITATGSNGQSPTVSVYSDIDSTWTGQSNNTGKTFTSNSGTSIYELTANGQATYSQSANEQALWGQAVFASKAFAGATLSHGSGPSATVRKQFVKDGSLSNADQFSGTAADNVVAFSQSLGGVNSSGTTVRVAIGHVREAAINYLGKAQTHYYRSKFPDTTSAVNQFFNDYDDAFNEAKDLDSQIQTTGTSVAGSKYADILALSVRQIFGAIDLTIPNSTLNTANASAFIKEISSDGNVNTVDIIFPMMPFFYTLAPKWIRLLLEPIAQYLQTGGWPHPNYVIHDIGAAYPNATGHNDGDAESMPIEETGDFLMLFLAYQQATGDNSFTTTYGNLLQRYATYLQNNGLYPVNQLSTTDGLGPFTNMTALAIKSAVGLSAYGTLTGQSRFNDLGKSFASTILKNGLGTRVSQTTKEPYLTLTYGNTSWYLQFNLYPDQLLGLNTFNQSVFKDQTDFYPTVRQQGGVPIDDGAIWGKTDWDSWVAAYSTSQSTKDMFIDDIWKYISNGKNSMPFSDKYNVAGDQEGIGQFRARPTVAAHFAPWALSKKPAPKRSVPVVKRRRFNPTGRSGALPYSYDGF
ncbi:putative glutaminase [Viridothelium virens]|uniref:Putative glutaminase n=1 Tax=Viridothelium virens TaxID=1048519 RepID=A0A6A6H5G9_VIRVR|nr:putative glutaminase [Viridothelium virens]